MSAEKSISLVLAVLIFFTVVPAVSAQGDAVTVKINGILQEYEQPAEIINSRTMVPLRGIFEGLGAEVEWDTIQQKVTARKGSINVELTIGSAEAVVSGEKKMLDSPAVIVNGRTLVPARFVSDALGAIVEWDQARYTVNIYTVSEELYSVLKRFDDKFDKSVLDWCISLWDNEAGGFYYAISSRDNEGFEADIETTSQMLGNITDMGMIPWFPSDDIMPKEIKDKMVKFMQERQDAGDGYFYDKQFGKDVIESKRNRNLTQATTLIERLGEEPLYDTPMERLQQQSSIQTSESSGGIPDYLKSKSAFMAWIESLPWDTNSYYAGNAVTTAKVMIKAAGFLNDAIEFIKSKQNQETGLWGEGLSYDTLNGAMKVSSMFIDNDPPTPFPNIDKMMESVVYVVKNFEAVTTAMVWNPLPLVNNAKKSYGGSFTQQQKEIFEQSFTEMASIMCDSLDNFRQPDNGYSLVPEGSSPKSQGVLVSKGLKEGDVNGTALAILTRRDVYILAGIKPPPLWDIYRDYFWDKLLNAKPVEKSKLIIGCDVNFDDMAIGDTPAGWSKKAVIGSVMVAKDPDSKNNQAMEIVTGPGEATTASIQAISGSDFKKVIFECKLNVYEFSNTYPYLFYISLGKTAVDWCLSVSADKVNLSNRRSGNGVGKVIATLDADTWYHLKIEYEPKDINDTVIRYYIDGDLIKETNEYFNNGDEIAKPLNKIEGLSFTSFLSAEATVYFDDVKMYVE